jgi:hypothetical protein
VTGIVAQGIERAAELEDRVVHLRGALQERLDDGGFSESESAVLERVRERTVQGMEEADQMARRAALLRARLAEHAMTHR